MKQHGFSIIELLTVITIIGLLAAIALPQFMTYRKKGFESRVISDLRQVAIAEEAYFADYEVYKSCNQNNCPALLEEVPHLSTGVTLQITATSSGFTGTASHPQLSGKTCSWNPSAGGFQGCS